MRRSLAVTQNRRTRKFLFWVIVFWVVSLFIWGSITPRYGQLMAAVANTLVHKLPFSDCEVSYKADGSNIKAHTYFSVRKAADGSQEYYEGDPGWDARRFNFSFTVWFALALATPWRRKWWRKAVWFMLGWAVIFVTQVLSLYLQTIHQNMLFVRTLLGTGLYLQPSTLEIVLAFAGRYSLLIGNVLFPLLVWLPVGIAHLGCSNEESFSTSAVTQCSTLPS
jgi:hypothetical protein